METNFVEANALLAVIRGDIDEAMEILGGLSMPELNVLATDAEKLSELCDELRGHVRVLS